MKVLVIPDVHLKPHMFRRASDIMHQKMADQAVCLMDIADDWNKAYELNLYNETYDEAISFAKAFPETKFCWGNHDLSYRWYCYESGYSRMASYTVQKKLIELQQALPEHNPIQYVQKLDNVLFAHGGVLDYFVETHVPESLYHDVDKVVEELNKLGKDEMWNDASPIWLRPQKNVVRLYKSGTCLQVVGHTPMKEITRAGNLISCDVFSTYSDGRKIGTEEFLVLDTITWEYRGIRI